MQRPGTGPLHGAVRDALRIDCMFSGTAVAAQHRVSVTALLPAAASPSQRSRSIALAGTDGLMGGNVYRKVQVS